MEKNGSRTANYRDLFPVPAAAGDVLNCAEAGVLGMLPGLIGTMQAAEVIKLITGINQLLTNCVLTYNALTNELFQIAIAPFGAVSGGPKTKAAFLKWDYDWACASTPVEISAADFETLLHDASVTGICKCGKPVTSGSSSFSRTSITVTEASCSNVSKSAALISTGVEAQAQS